MRCTTSFVMFAALMMTAAPVAAQPRLGRLPIGIRGFVDASSQTFNASDSFNAILGEARGTFVGGGAQVTWKQFVIEVSGSRFKKTGERAFVFAGTVFNLGIPTTITMTPIDVTALYRLPRVWKVAPYAGGGFGRQRYKETSEFADESENIDVAHKTYHAAAGAEVRVWRWIGAAGEVRYRRAPDVIGENGVSREFNEKDLGGTALHVKIIVGR